MSTGLTPSLVLQLIDDGQSQSQIARDFGVSRQYVSKLAKQGGFENPLNIMYENLPWEVKKDFVNNTIWKNVRRHGIWVSTGKLGEGDKAHLRSFYRKLLAFNVVVDYDPEYPSIPGISNTNGFAFAARTPEDEDFVVKIRPGTRITAIGDRLWRIPKDTLI